MEITMFAGQVRIGGARKPGDDVVVTEPRVLADGAVFALHHFRREDLQDARAGLAED